MLSCWIIIDRVPNGKRIYKKKPTCFLLSFYLGPSSPVHWEKKVFTFQSDLQGRKSKRKQRQRGFGKLGADNICIPPPGTTKIFCIEWQNSKTQSMFHVSALVVTFVIAKSILWCGSFWLIIFHNTLFLANCNHRVLATDSKKNIII